MNPRISSFSDKSRPHLKWRVYYTDESDNRRDKKFRTKEAAEQFRLDHLSESERIGIRNAAKLTDQLKDDALHASRVLDGYGKTLVEAAKFYAEHLDAIKESRPIVELSSEFLESMKRSGKSPRYIGDLRARLGKFTQAYSKRHAADFSSREIERWLARLQVAERTRNHYRRVLSAFYSWCERLGYVRGNPVSKTTKSKPKPTNTEVFTLIEMRMILDFASSLKRKDVLASVCIGAFAGIRQEEITRLDWSAIRLDRGVIDLGQEHAKTAKRRIVEIQPVLRDWLVRYFPIRDGPICEKGYERRLRRFRETIQAGDAESGRAPIRWKHNGLRHSYASYLLEITQNPGYVSLQLGHNNSHIIFSNYRELVAKADAEAYWKLQPSVLS